LPKDGGKETVGALLIVPAGSPSANLANPLIFIGGGTASQTAGAANSANPLTDALSISGLATLADCDVYTPIPLAVRKMFKAPSAYDPKRK
jgi:hypothetical protein